MVSFSVFVLVVDRTMPRCDDLSVIGIFSLLNLNVTSGLDPTTDIAIIRCYILPILTYGLEILQPRSQNMNKLEQFLKALLKRILSLPPNVPDPALYVISGLLPVQAQIDIKCLILYVFFLRKYSDSQCC
jgi:hypothetical protein